METTIPITPVERFVNTFFRGHHKGSQLNAKMITAAIALIDQKLTNDRVNLRVQPGQYSHLTLGVQFYLSSMRVSEGNKQSVLRAKALLQAQL